MALERLLEVGTGLAFSVDAVILTLFIRGTAAAGLKGLLASTTREVLVGHIKHVRGPLQVGCCSSF